MKLQVLSQQSLRDLAAMRRKVLGQSAPLGRPPAQRPADVLWYWAELVADLDAPDNAWTDAQIGYAKLMVPDPENDDDPRHFIEMATGAIAGATNASPIVITSTGHGRQVGDLVYLSGVLGNTGANGPWVVANPTADTFELSGSTGSGAYTSGGNWYLCVQFVNRSVGLSGSTGTACKLEYAWGEWTLKWIDC